MSSRQQQGSINGGGSNRGSIAKGAVEVEIEVGAKATALGGYGQHRCGVVVVMRSSSLVVGLFINN